jgi:regulator of nucleoside diphosphate kinase
MRTLAFDPFSDIRSAPAIILGNRDLRRLRALVERHVGGPASTLAEQLDAELDRVIVVPQAQVPAEVVGIGSRVALEELDTTLRREVVLAVPEEVGVGGDRLSILSPLAIALLGVAAGETVEYGLRSGRLAEVRLLSVTRGGDGP